MKTVFIVNPNAGRGEKFHNAVEAIKNICSKFGAEIYVTKFAGDASIFVRDYCTKNGPTRFIACGGDGTFNEVLNGAIGFEGTQLGIVPIGTGNDFCRNFASHEGFFDLEKQMFAECVKCDAIKYDLKTDSNIKSGFCANMFNVGFDCAVVDTTNEVKEKTFFNGSLAYFISIFINLVKKKTSNLEVEIDGTSEFCGELLLTSIANGCYCGGGLKTNPIACTNDGNININIVKNISRLKFLKLLPRYINGTYLKLKNIENIVSSKRCRKVKITSPKCIRISIDGEITNTQVSEFEIVHNAFNFVVPSKLITEGVNVGAKSTV